MSEDIIARAREIDKEWRARGWDGSEEDAKRFYAEFLRKQIADLQSEIRDREQELADLLPLSIPPAVGLRRVN